MIIKSTDTETEYAENVAYAMCAAARTAPKTRGIDHVTACVVLDQDIVELATEMERLGETLNKASFLRDAKNVKASQAVVLIGTTEKKRGLQDVCQYCHFENCEACDKADGVCVYDPMDLGIAIGSAVATAADHRVDSRVMFSVGRAAKSLELMGDETTMIIGIPISISGKSPYFDRK